MEYAKSNVRPRERLPQWWGTAIGKHGGYYYYFFFFSIKGQNSLRPKHSRDESGFDENSKHPRDRRISRRFRDFRLNILERARYYLFRARTSRYDYSQLPRICGTKQIVWTYEKWFVRSIANERWCNVERAFVDVCRGCIIEKWHNANWKLIENSWNSHEGHRQRGVLARRARHVHVRPIYTSHKSCKRRKCSRRRVIDLLLARGLRNTISIETYGSPLTVPGRFYE